jgi:hypothetical protein
VIVLDLRRSYWPLGTFIQVRFRLGFCPGVIESAPAESLEFTKRENNGVSPT